MSTVATTAPTEPRRTWPALLVFLGLCAGVAAAGAASSAGSRETYAALQTPSWAPPSSVFGPVWTVLYVMIAVAGWLLWRTAGRGPALVWWGVQLLLNLAWSPLFFGLGRYGLALVDIVALWLAIAATIVVAWRRSRAAALLLVPYLAWVTFATALNAAVVRLN